MRAFGCVASVLVMALPGALHAAQSPGMASLTVVVLDPAGAQVPSAWITVLDGPEDAPGVIWTYHAGPEGGLRADLPPGTYTLRVEAPGFAPVLLEHVQVRDSGRRTVRLALARVSETVLVERDRQDAALDPRGFSTFLSREQIDALPDDPEAFAQALQALAPPGAVIRIDGFTGGTMPPKSQILSIRLPRFDVYAAQDHGGLSGVSYIEIVTTPGGGRVQGSAEAAVRHHALNARNPLAAEQGVESTQVGGFSVDGPLVPGGASFAAAVRVVQEEETTALRAVLPDGHVLSDPVTRPATRVTVNGRVTLALPAGHTLRVGASTERRESRNLGVGDINLPERAFSAWVSQTAVRASAGGPLGRRAYLDARVQARWTGTRSVSAVERPAIRVLDAFAAGGAQAAGGTRSLDILAAADLDYARGAHAWRAGGLLESSGHHVDRRSNYLGTYTFTSLDSYRAGTPAAYSRRTGSPDVAYRNLQIGLYVQDDYRAARSLLLSYGVRYERQALAGGMGRLLPRAGLAWSPLPAGRTTVRLGAGLFSEWIPMSVYEHSLVLDGTRQHEVLVPHPSYPTPPEPDGFAAGLPRERYLLAGDLRLPSSVGLSVGLEQQLGWSVRLYAGYARRAGWHLLRGQNLNAPVHGVRPDPAHGNVVQAMSDARLQGHTVTVHAATTDVTRRWSLVAAYVFSKTLANTTGAFSVPASGGLAGEWGPTGPAHALTGTVTVRVVPQLAVTVQPQWRTGTPYTITTGRDDNGDGVFTDRPPGLPRNSARTPPQWEAAVRLAYVVRFGRTAGGAAGASPAAGTASSLDGGDASRYRVELFAQAKNVTNTPNYVSMGAVSGSPLFGRPTVAINPRRLEIGARLAF